MIIDVNTFLGHYPFRQVRSTTASGLIAQMDASGIAAAAISSLQAVFYRDAGEERSYETVGPVGQYFTGDREMSPFRNYLVGMRLSYLKFANEKGKVGRVFQSIDVHGRLDLMGYQALTPLPPNLPRSDGFIDAIIAQIGIAMIW